MSAPRDAEAALDRMYGRVFAKHEAKILLTALHRMGRTSIDIAEIIERVQRQRARWGDLSDSPLILPDKERP